MARMRSFATETACFAPTLLTTAAMSRWELPRHHCARPPGRVGGFAEGLSPGPALRVVDLARRIRRCSTVPGVSTRNESGLDLADPRPRRNRSTRGAGK